MRLGTSRVADVVATVLVAVLATAGGATAGTVLTGARIKDGTVTTADLRNGTLTGRDFRDGRVTGRSVRDSSVELRDLSRGASTRLTGEPGRSESLVGRTVDIPAGSAGSAAAECPAGTMPISVHGAFTQSNSGIQTRIVERTGVVFGENLGNTPLTLFVEVVCAEVQP